MENVQQLVVLLVVSYAFIVGAQDDTDFDYCATGDSLPGCPCFKDQCGADIEVRYSCIKTCNSCAEVEEHFRKLDAAVDVGPLRNKRSSISRTNMKLVARAMARQKRTVNSDDDQGGCKDQIKVGCDCWKKIGYCTSSVGYEVRYMKQGCAKTCKFC